VRDQLITGALVVGLLAVGGLLIQPQRRQLAEACAQVRTLQAEVAAREQQGLSAVDAETRLQRSRQALAHLQDRIPAEARLGPLLEKLDRLATETGLTAQDLTPRPPEVSDGVGVVTIAMTFESSFAALYGFLEGIESLDRLVRVATVDTQYKEGSSGTLITTLKLEVYFEAN